MYIIPTWSPQNWDGIIYPWILSKWVFAPKFQFLCFDFLGVPDSICIWGCFYIFSQYTIHLTQLQFQGRSTSVFNSISCPKLWTLQKISRAKVPKMSKKMLIFGCFERWSPSSRALGWWFVGPLKASIWLRIGFVGQEPVLFNTTVRANLMYGLDESDTHVNDEYVRKCLFLRIWSGGLRRLVTWMGWAIWWCSGSLGDVFHSHPPKVQIMKPQVDIFHKNLLHQILLHSDFHPLHFGSWQTWRQIRSWQILLIGLIACMVLFQCRSICGFFRVVPEYDYE